MNIMTTGRGMELSLTNIVTGPASNVAIQELQASITKFPFIPTHSIKLFFDLASLAPIITT